MTTKSVINAMCKVMRASGLPAQETRPILNVVQKWINSNGIEWTNSRLKELHQWYISYISEEHPVIPEWWKHTKSGLPCGPFKCVFQLRNHQRALAILSMHTAFISKDLLASQLQKMEKGLNGNGNTQSSVINWQEQQCHTEIFRMVRRRVGYKTPEVPGFTALTGNSIPYGKHALRISDKTTKSEIVEAYVNSWLNLPDATVEYLLLTGHERHLPAAWIPYLDQVEIGREVTSGLPECQERIAKSRSLNGDILPNRPAGRLTPLEQESLKVRWIANPNRITQSYLAQTLGHQWYEDLRTLPTDCTYNQQEALDWAQSKLRKGVVLHSSDLTSATDLLNRRACMNLVEYYLRGSEIPEYVFQKNMDWSSYDYVRQAQSEHSGSNELAYLNWNLALRHFDKVSGSQWYFQKEDREVRWEQGQPLGTSPSFALLGLSNNLIAMTACCLYNSGCRNNGHPENQVEIQDSFRVVGDDILMDNKIAPLYEQLICKYGGEINPSKCITSNRCAEIAGWIVERDVMSLKRVKAKDPSDNNFIELCDRLGPQSRSLLLPHQRKNYDEFKFIPGYVVPGPYAKNSYGESFNMRYSWYLSCVEPILQRDKLQPDLDRMDGDQFRLYIKESLASTNSELGDTRSRSLSKYLPRDLISDFQSDRPSKTKRSGDPRLEQGQTLVQRLDKVRSDPGFTPYTEFETQIGERLTKNDGVAIPGDNLQVEQVPKSPESFIQNLMKEVLDLTHSELNGVKVETPENCRTR